MMQQEEDTEPRRTKEFITRRHSRVVDEKAIMEFYEQYSPLATKIKRRGVESSIENRENANPNSPVLSNSPRPTKRRSIAKATDIEGLEKEEPSDLFKAGEHQIPPKSEDEEGKPVNPVITKTLRKGKRKSDVDILCAELTAASSSPGKKRRTSVTASQIAGEALSPLAAGGNRGHKRRVSYSSRDMGSSRGEEEEEGEAEGEEENVARTPRDLDYSSADETSSSSEKHSKRGFLTRAFSRNRMKSSDAPAVPRDAPMVSLVKILTDQSMLLVDTIVSKAPPEVVDEFVQVCVPLFDYVDSSQSLYEWALSKDVAECSSSGKDTLFRGESFIAKIIAQHMKHHGIPYLQRILADTLQELSVAQEDLEIDPMKIRVPEQEKAAKIEQNCARLVSLAERLSNKIFSEVEAIPPSFCRIFSLVRLATKKINPALRLTVVGSFFFLRFISLALVVPQEFGLVKELLPEKVRRATTLLGKVLQTLSNQIEFGEKEYFMVPFNSYLRNTIPRMKRFLKTISTVKDAPDTVVDPVDMLTAPGCGLWDEDGFIESLHGMRKYLLSERAQFILTRHQIELDDQVLWVLQNFPAELTETQKAKARKKKEKQQKKNNKAKLKKSASQRKLKDDKKTSSSSSSSFGLDRRRSSSNILGLLSGSREIEEDEHSDREDGTPSAHYINELTKYTGAGSGNTPPHHHSNHFGTPGRRQMNKLLSTSKKLIQLPRSDSRPFLRAKRKNSITNLNNLTLSLSTSTSSGGSSVSPSPSPTSTPIRNLHNMHISSTTSTPLAAASKETIEAPSPLQSND